VQQQNVFPKHLSEIKVRNKEYPVNSLVTEGYGRFATVLSNSEIRPLFCLCVKDFIYLRVVFKYNVLHSKLLLENHSLV